jgi:hypothetical protein
MITSTPNKKLKESATHWKGDGINFFQKRRK